jgi:hypothetical protein
MGQWYPLVAARRYTDCVVIEAEIQLPVLRDTIVGDMVFKEVDEDTAI